MVKSSLGDFIEEGVVDFAKKTPGTVVYISPQSSRIPKIVAEYCMCSLLIFLTTRLYKINITVHCTHCFCLLSAVNGKVQEETVTNKTSQQIAELITKMSNQSGLDIIRIRKPFHTSSPSIQGQWHPFTNRPLRIDPVGPQAK
ncbi:39S ribosomal protein L43 [Triplophysa rosa]|uniref:39S ribosomal protein L43 n=1 Tax=Triplophysa rosa TaxID=992332 RepID=A0A9W7WGK8_TRIRA|nr:39S ribosomal protein L43 [Triplophysa rosa]